MESLEEKSRYFTQIQKAIEYLDVNFQNQPNLEDVAFHVGMSKYHFSRIFKQYAGISPMQFLQATTLSHAKEKIKSSKSLLDTSLELGLSSTSRLHELFVNFMGVTPNEYKKMGENLDVTYGFGYSPFGKTMVATTKKGVCSLEFYDDSYDDILKRLKKSWENAKFIHDDKSAQKLLNEIFINKKKIDIFVKGTNFQINVWRALLNTKNGELFTYSDVANFVKKPKAVRAVATAIGSNHIGYIIPCHRIISKTLSIGGYRWGAKRKKIIHAYELGEI